MNLFKVRCKSCKTLYNDVIENGKSILLHAGFSSSNDQNLLPTPECIKVYDYVVFQDCGHCSPEVFEECRACKLGYVGKYIISGSPTEEKCYCRYAIIDSKSSLSSLKDLESKLVMGNVKEVLLILLTKINENDNDLYNEVLLQLMKFNRLEKGKSDGVLTTEEYSIQRSKIDIVAIDLINKIK